MKILAFDTSSASGSAAIVADGAVLAQWSSPAVAAHAVWLLPAIDGLLNKAHLKIKDMDVIAVTNGPGSFTGLRIGVSVAKGLSWSLGMKTAGVQTLYALAMNFVDAGMPVCTVLDARKHEIYAAVYGFDSGAPNEIMAACAVTPDELSNRLSALDLKTPLLFAGSGLAAYSGYITAHIKGAVLAPEPLWNVKASNVAIKALEMAGRQGLVDPPALSLVYLRKSEAEFKKQTRS